MSLCRSSRLEDNGLRKRIVRIKLVPPLRNVSRCQSIVVPTLAVHALEAPVLRNFDLCQANRVSRVTSRKETVPINFHQQDIAFNCNRHRRDFMGTRMISGTACPTEWHPYKFVKAASLSR